MEDAGTFTWQISGDSLFDPLTEKVQNAIMVNDLMSIDSITLGDDTYKVVYKVADYDGVTFTIETEEGTRNIRISLVDGRDDEEE